MGSPGMMSEEIRIEAKKARRAKKTKSPFCFYYCSSPKNSNYAR
jgi:hypothetical protein